MAEKNPQNLRKLRDTHRAAAIEATVVAKRLTDTLQQVSHQRVVAGKGAGHNVAVHKHIPHSALRQA
jgi:hypothetical protein